MNIINRKSKEVLLGGGRASQRFYIKVKHKEIYFTAAVGRYCDLKEGLFVHFLNDGSDWEFYISDDTDGFRLCPIRSKGGFIVCNTGLTKMLLSSFGFKGEKRFSIEKLNRFIDKNQLFKISTDNVSTAKS